MESSLVFTYSEGNRNLQTTQNFNSIVRFDEKYLDIFISIVYFPQRNLFSVNFSKKGDQYYPKDYNFVSHYWEGLLLDIEGEMRVPEFNNFIGIGKWTSLLRMIKMTANPIFQKFC